MQVVRGTIHPWSSKKAACCLRHSSSSPCDQRLIGREHGIGCVPVSMRAGSSNAGSWSGGRPGGGFASTPTAGPHGQCRKSSTLFHLLESFCISHGLEETCWHSSDQFSPECEIRHLRKRNSAMYLFPLQSSVAHPSHYSDPAGCSSVGTARGSVYQRLAHHYGDG